MAEKIRFMKISKQSFMKVYDQNAELKAEIARLKAEIVELKSQIAEKDQEAETGCRHTIGTSVDEDGCCISCGADLNSIAMAAAERDNNH